MPNYISPNRVIEAARSRSAAEWQSALLSARRPHLIDSALGTAYEALFDVSLEIVDGDIAHVFDGCVIRDSYALSKAMINAVLHDDAVRDGIRESVSRIIRDDAYESRIVAIADTSDSPSDTIAVMSPLVHHAPILSNFASKQDLEAIREAVRDPDLGCVTGDLQMSPVTDFRVVRVPLIYGAGRIASDVLEPLETIPASLFKAG